MDYVIEKPIIEVLIFLSYKADEAQALEAHAEELKRQNKA